MDEWRRVGPRVTQGPDRGPSSGLAGTGAAFRAVPASKPGECDASADPARPRRPHRRSPRRRLPAGSCGRVRADGSGSRHGPDAARSGDGQRRSRSRPPGPARTGRGGAGTGAGPGRPDRGADVPRGWGADFHPSKGGFRTSAPVCDTRTWCATSASAADRDCKTRVAPAIAGIASGNAPGSSAVRGCHRPR